MVLIYEEKLINNIYIINQKNWVLTSTYPAFTALLMHFNFYVYNRRGKCLYYKEWSRPLNTLSDDPDEEKRLMYVCIHVCIVLCG